MKSPGGPFRTQVASDVVRDGLGVELIDEENRVLAEVFLCDADHTVSFRLLVEELPLHAIETLIDRARERRDPFEDRTKFSSCNRDA